MPSAFNFMRLFGAYGPEFLAEVYPAHLGWLSEAATASRAKSLDDQIAALQAQRARL